MKGKPYVVSADIHLLLEKWAERKNFVLPQKDFFLDLREKFSGYMIKLFPTFELVSEEEILNFVTRVANQTNLPVVSLDPVYFCGDYTIELTRTVDSKGTDQGLRCRSGSYSLLKQLDRLKHQKNTKVCLVDDVIFSGVLAERVIELLSRIDIEVIAVCAGIGIQEGISRISRPSRRICCLKIYEDIIDEVCERDFYLGIPYSGRSLVNSDNVGSPYIIPYGRPDKWASIPILRQRSFSEFCISQTILLFEEVEKSSKRIVDCSDIERKVFDQPETGRYIDFLRKIRL